MWLFRLFTFFSSLAFFPRGLSARPRRREWVACTHLGTCRTRTALRAMDAPCARAHGALFREENACDERQRSTSSARTKILERVKRTRKERGKEGGKKGGKKRGRERERKEKSACACVLFHAFSHKESNICARIRRLFPLILRCEKAISGEMECVSCPRLLSFPPPLALLCARILFRAFSSLARREFPFFPPIFSAQSPSLTSSSHGFAPFTERVLRVRRCPTAARRRRGSRPLLRRSWS